MLLEPLVTAALAATIAITPITTALEPVDEPTIIERYEAVTMTEDEYELMAQIVYLESRGEPFDGQQAVAEVILNRVIADNFPDTVTDVLYQKGQFATIHSLHLAEPTQTQYDAIDAALYGPSILPDDVVFFSVGGENDRVWGEIGGHVFCREYIWE